MEVISSPDVAVGPVSGTMLYTFIGPAGMLEHSLVAGVAPPPPAAVLVLPLLLQAAAKSKRAAPSAAGTAVRRMPTERGSGIGKPPVGSDYFYLRISKA
jgi:hypothetical protein